MASLEITLFGTLRVQRPGQPVLQFPTRRVRDLFSYLLLNRHTLHSREVLAEQFWDGSKESNPRHCLNTALWRLNRVLGEPDAGAHPFLRVDSQHIGFNTASDCRIDIVEFENRCLWAEQIGGSEPEQQAALYRQAVDLYQADLLVDCYEEWCLAGRERLQRMYLAALHHLVDYYAARGEYGPATECATRLLACDPLREDVHCRLIEFHLATSQPAAALRQYRECESILRRELGVAPTRETQAHLSRIFSAGRGALAQASAPPAATETPLPPLESSLALAVTRLREAVADFDRAHAQLRNAATAVEGLASPLLRTFTPAARSRVGQWARTDEAGADWSAQDAATILREVEQVVSQTARSARRLATA